MLLQGWETWGSLQESTGHTTLESLHLEATKLISESTRVVANRMASPALPHTQWVWPGCGWVRGYSPTLPHTQWVWPGYEATALPYLTPSGCGWIRGYRPALPHTQWVWPGYEATAPPYRIPSGCGLGVAGYKATAPPYFIPSGCGLGVACLTWVLGLSSKQSQGNGPLHPLVAVDGGSHAGSDLRGGRS